MSNDWNNNNNSNNNDNQGIFSKAGNRVSAAFDAALGNKSSRAKGEVDTGGRSGILGRVSQAFQAAFGSGKPRNPR